jgi:hypothetical protein
LKFSRRQLVAIDVPATLRQTLQLLSWVAWSR